MSDCELTLKELTAVKKSFVFTLTSMLHGRVSYPEDEDRDKQPAKPVPTASRENKNPGKTSDDAGAKPGAGKDVGESIPGANGRSRDHNSESEVSGKK